MTISRYSEYRRSGVDWLGDVPAHWGVVPLKRNFEVRLGKMLQGEASSESDEVKPYLRAANIQWSGVETSDIKSMWISLKERSELMLRVGDLLVSEGGDVGRSCLWQAELPECYFQNSVNRVRSRGESDTKYLYYWMVAIKSKGFIDVICNKSTIAHFTAEKVAEVPVPFPPLQEQFSIAAFLDRETAKIDALIAEQEHLLALLAEKRQAVISHAVTKGLNTDAPMMDSGVTWLGEVPAHWEIKRIGHILEAIGDVDHIMPASVDKGVPYLMTGDLEDFLSDVCLENCKQVSEDDYLRLSRKIRGTKGDVVMARYATIGTLMYIDIDVDFLVSYSCVTLKPDRVKTLGMYLFYYMKSDAFKQGVEHKVNTNTQGNVGIEDLKSLKIAMPGIKEQFEIAAFLDSEFVRSSALKSEGERVIELLKERRSSLIAAAVTGQIDVREAAR